MEQEGVGDADAHGAGGAVVASVVIPGMYAPEEVAQNAAAVADAAPLSQEEQDRMVVNLIEVDVIRAQVAQAGLDILGHGLPVPGHGLRGQDELVPAALDGLPDKLLADGADLMEQAAEKNVGFIGMKPLAGGAIEDAALALRYIAAHPHVSVVIP